MSTVVSEVCGGAATLESRAPAVGPAPTKVSGPSLTCASGTAVSGDETLVSIYVYDAVAGTAACTGIVEWAATLAASGSSLAVLQTRRQADGSCYQINVQMNGTLGLYKIDSGGGAAALTSWSSLPNLGNASWYRLTAALNEAFDFTINLINASTRGELDSGPNVCLSDTYTDSSAAVAAAGRVGFQVQRSVFGLLTYTDSASGGGGTAVGLATETDTALALAGKQVRAAGMAAETDTALALTPVTLAGLPFNTAPYEFGQRTGLDVDDFSLYASTSLNVSVFADADVLLASRLFAYTESTGTNGRLTRKTHASLTASAYYFFVARNADGSMSGCGRIQAT